MNPHHAELAIIDRLIEPWFSVLGRDFKGYRNHCRRVFLFCCALARAEGEQRERIAITAVYHDLGIWVEGTFDYLEPSKQLARAYLASTGQTEWAEEIETMIEEHHKVTPWSINSEWLVEPFRKADWIDVSLGALTFDLDRHYIHKVRRRYPNAGFHLTLASLTFERMKTNPKDPLPMFRW